MQDFDKLWNYYEPAATEEKFREVEATLDKAENPETWLQLQTQIARTFSLRRQFDKAHETLDAVSALLPADNAVSKVRYHLERGRAFNSAGKKDEAKPQFEKAREIAESINEDFYAIDAVHMLAIAAVGDEAVKLNEEGVIMAEKSTMDRAKGWLGALYNNLAWSYFDKGQFEKALSIFLRAVKWREEKKSEREIQIAKWCVGRTLRALGRLDEALTIQLGLMEEMIDKDKPNGYVYEELGELYLIKNEPVHKMYFQFAYNELSKDMWMVDNEAQRLNRMKELAKEDN